MNIQAEYDDEKLQALLKQSRGRVERQLREWAVEASTLIGASATGKYMRDTGVTTGSTFGKISKVSKRNTGRLLRIITGRLARSILGGRRTYAQGQGGAIESIEEIKMLGPSQVQLTKGSRVPYAAVHEYGGRAGRGRRAMIPARPYLRPAVNDNTERLQKSLVQRIQLELARLNG